MIGGTMDRAEWVETLNRLSANGNEVALDASEAKELAALLTEEVGGDDNGEGDTE